MGGYEQQITKVLGLAAAAAVTAGVASAQEGGLQFSGLFAQSFEFSDNPDFIVDPTGNTLRSRTNLSFSLDSITPVDALSADFGFGLRYTLATTSDDFIREGVTDPFFRIDYGRTSATARFDFGLGYSQSDVGDLDFITDPATGDLVVDDGEVERTNLNLGIDTGIGAPIGFSFDATYRRRVYTETTDPDLADDETLEAFTSVRFQVTPTTNVSALARYGRDQEFEGSTFDRRTRRLGFGVDHELSASNRFDFELTGDQIDTFDEGVDSREEGYSAIFGYEQDLPDGQYRIDASSILEDIGSRNRLTASRDFALPDGSLGFLIGVTNSDTSDLAPVFSVDWQRDLRTGQVGLFAEQTITQDDTGDDEFRNRLLRANYSQEINSVSSWDASLVLAQSDDLTDGSVDDRADFEFSYRHDITRDWQVVSGYRYQEFWSTDDDDRRSNTVFVTFERPFAVRP